MQCYLDSSTLTLGDSSIIKAGEYFHFTGPNRKGAMKVAYANGSIGNWGGWS